MPGSVLGELVLGPILEVVFVGVGYVVGVGMVPALTLGRWRAEPLLSRPRGREARRRARWGMIPSTIHPTPAHAGARP
jgi:hypothetical protein